MRTFSKVCKEFRDSCYFLAVYLSLFPQLILENPTLMGNTTIALHTVHMEQQMVIDPVSEPQTISRHHNFANYLANFCRQPVQAEPINPNASLASRDSCGK